MKMGFRERLGIWLEQLGWLDGVLLRYDGEAPGGQRYVNRLNRHVVVR